MAFLKPNALVIHDRLTAPEPVPFQWVMHSYRPFEVTENGTRVETDHGPVQVQFVSPGGLEMSVSDAFPIPPHEWAEFELEEWHFEAETREPGAEQEFLVVIGLNDAVSKVAYDETAGRLSLEVDGAPWQVDLTEAALKVTPPAAQ